MNTELRALRDAGCKCIQIEEPTLHFWANTYGRDHEEVKFMIEAYNREVQGLDDIEIWGLSDTSPTPEAVGHVMRLSNYPNPFNPLTRIEFTLERAGRAVAERTGTARATVAAAAEMSSRMQCVRTKRPSAS